MNLHGRSFLTLKDYTKEEIRYLLDLAHKLKADKKKGILGKSLVGKNIVLLFEKTSTRTRCAFEVAALDEGGHVTYLSNSQMGKKESIEDTAKVLEECMMELNLEVLNKVQLKHYVIILGFRFGMG